MLPPQASEEKLTYLENALKQIAMNVQTYNEINVKLVFLNDDGKEADVFLLKNQKVQFDEQDQILLLPLLDQINSEVGTSIEDHNVAFYSDSLNDDIQVGIYPYNINQDTTVSPVDDIDFQRTLKIKLSYIFALNKCNSQKAY